jgi:hypothetical protein
LSCHSGATRSVEPGIHNHDREYGFRACAKRRIPEWTAVVFERLALAVTHSSLRGA